MDRRVSMIKYSISNKKNSSKYSTWLIIVLDLVLIIERRNHLIVFHFKILKRSERLVDKGVFTGKVRKWVVYKLLEKVHLIRMNSIMSSLSSVLWIRYKI
jgi:hypothetical protein